MKGDRLSLIGSRIKEIRNEKKMTLRELAKNSGLSPGLISKIENFRTMPSIAVLIDIADSLEVDVADLVRNINGEDELPFILVRKADSQTQFRTDSPELIYEFLLSKNVRADFLQAHLVTVPAGVYRKPVSTSAKEVVYVVSGAAEYAFNEDVCALEEGDTLYFDGSVPHSVQNRGAVNAVLFKVYLTESGDLAS